MFYFDDFYNILEGYEMYSNLDEKQKMNDFLIDNGLTINIETRSKNVSK